MLEPKKQITIKSTYSHSLVHVLDTIDGLSHIEPRKAPVAPHLHMLGIVSVTRAGVAPIGSEATGELHLVQAMPQIVASDVLHLVVQSAVVLECVVQGHDTRVVQPMQSLNSMYNMKWVNNHGKQC